MTNEELRVCVVGLGEVGLPTALHYEKIDTQLVGYDISSDVVKRARAAGLSSVTSDWEEVPTDTDVYIVCVNTRNPVKECIDPSIVFDACHKMTGTEPQLVSIESTIGIGTTRLVWERIFDRQVRVCHVPHRYWKRDPQKRGVQRRRPLGVPHESIMSYAKWFYQEVSGVPIDTASNVETAEIVKVAENAWIYVWVAFAEELTMFCDQYGIDYEELRTLIASASDVPEDKRWAWQPQYNLARAEQGIGGDCLPMAVDSLIMDSSDTSVNKLISRSRSGVNIPMAVAALDLPLLAAAKRTDAAYKAWLAKKREGEE